MEVAAGSAVDGGVAGNLLVSLGAILVFGPICQSPQLD